MSLCIQMEPDTKVDRGLEEDMRIKGDRTEREDGQRPKLGSEYYFM